MLSFRRCLAPSGASDESAKLVFTLTLLFVMSPFSGLSLLGEQFIRPATIWLISFRVQHNFDKTTVINVYKDLNGPVN